MPPVKLERREVGQDFWLWEGKIGKGGVRKEMLGSYLVSAGQEFLVEFGFHSGSANLTGWQLSNSGKRKGNGIQRLFPEE